MYEQPVLSWKVAGLLLGLLLIVATALVKPLGVSTQYVVTDALVLHKAAPNVAESNEYLSTYGEKEDWGIGYGWMVVFGMLIGVPLSDKVGRKPVFISALLMDVLIFAYSITVNSLPGFIIAGVLLGIIGGLIIPLWSAYLGDIFGRASIATLFGFLTFAVGIIGGTGPVIYGWIFDKTASYNWAWITSGLCCIIALFLVLLIKKEVKEETSKGGADNK